MATVHLPTSTRHLPRLRVNLAPRFLSLFKFMQHRVRHYRKVAYQRKMLAQMSDHMLKDIGISRADALHEASKPFWR